MTDKEKLIDLIVSADISLFGTRIPYAEVYADSLLANGVTVPPCKINDTVYTVGIFTGQIIESKVLAICYEENDIWLLLSNTTCASVNQQLGKGFFLTKEEAEKALAELKNTK